MLIRKEKCRLWFESRLIWFGIFLQVLWLYHSGYFKGLESKWSSGKVHQQL